MKRLISAPLFVTSIIVLLAAVKARSADLPNVSHQKLKSDLKDSVKDNKNEIAQLVDHLMKHGRNARYGDNIAPTVGLPGARSTKGDNIRSKKFDKNRGGLNCSIIVEESSEEEIYDGKRPVCIFLEVGKLTGGNREDRFYKLNLEGQLERVVVVRSKTGEDGKTIRGSGVNSEEDITSPEVKKAFAAEMADVRQWLKQQQKIVAKKAAAAKTAPKK